MDFFLIVLIAVFIQQGNVLAKEFQSGESQVKLIELYSSEGCSSCPPAEEQLAKLTYHKNLWKTFVPINFHVDYWNRLGWVDPYSNAEFSRRQRDYARAWGVSGVYTPAFVLNGESLGPILNFDDLDKKVNFKNNVKINLTVENLKNSYTAKLNLKNLDEKKSYQVHMAFLGNGFVSDVNSGENKGKKLVQNFVALKHESKIYLNKAILFEFKQPNNSMASKYGVVAWVTEINRILPLQVVGGYL